MNRFFKKMLFVMLTGFVAVAFAQQDKPAISKGQLLPSPQILRSTRAIQAAEAIESTVFEEGFEAGGASWSASGSWAVGSPTSGPYNGHNSANCAATNLSGNYSNYANDRLTSPSISLPVITYPSSKLTLNF